MADIDIASPGANAAALKAALVDAIDGERSVTVNLSASQLSHLSSAPVSLVAAPGAGKIAVPLAVSLIYTVGTRLYYTATNLDHPQIAIGANYIKSAILDYQLGVDALSDTFYSATYVPLIRTDGSRFDPGTLENQPILLSNALGDMISYGEVTASTLLAGGSGYNIGDTGGFNENNTSGTYTVTGVSGGAVTTYTLDVVNGAQVGQTLTTFVSTGGGDGNFSITATAIAPGDGTATLILNYHILTL